MLKLAWLGSPLAILDGLPIHFETRKITALLAYLSLNPHENPREKLAALFWPEFDQAHALANLRRALSSLTRALPPGFIVTDRDTLRWVENAPFEIDVLKFQAGLQTARTHSHADMMTCRACLETLETAGELYRGEFLDGLNLPGSPAFDDWQYLTREELKRDFAWSLEQLAKGLAVQAAWDKAARAARRWVSLDRLEASAQCTLVEILTRSGQRSLAQRIVEEYFRLFQSEFGTEPEDETRRLFQQALDQDRPHRLERKPSPAYSPAASPVLLKTKLYLPKVKPNRVSRPRLISELNGIGDHKLTIVSAPAGFGKTSLLAEWAVQAELPVGWLSLDSGDNDSHQFLNYLCAALESLQEGIAGNASTLLESPQPVAPQTVTMVLLKDLERATEPMALVLDDYQFITAPPVHEVVAYILERSTAHLHLVIATRADPLLPLARLRAAGELLEVRTEELRFNLEECSDFFNQAMGLDILPGDITTLAARTEGWAVGLQMAAILIQGAPDRKQIIQTFSGSHRYILEYLIQEVLGRQPEHVRDFLLKTSILDRLCSGLCDEVIGKLERSDVETAETAITPAFQLAEVPAGERASEILDYLERSNLFLIPLDGERKWYRYHHLFADLLSLQLQRFPPGVIRELHLRACSWYERNGQIDYAIEHALTAGDFERAADLMEQDAQSLAYRVGFSRLQHWLDRLPPEMVLNRAWIGISQAWLWLVSGKLPALAQLMDQIEANATTLWVDRYFAIDRQDQLANIKCLRAYIAFFNGDLLRSMSLAGEALQLVRPGNEALHVRLLVQNGELHQTNREYARACDFLHQAIELGISLRDFQSTTTALMRIYRSLQLLGKLTQAEAVTQTVIRFLTEAGRMESPIAGKACLCWGDLLRERGRREEAREWLDQGLIQSRLFNIPFDTITALVFKVKWFYSERLWDQALQLLDEGLPLLKTYAIPPPIEFSWWLWRAKVCLEKGDSQAVFACLEQLSKFPENSSAFKLEEAALVLAKLHQREGKHAETLACLAPLAEGAEAGGRNGILLLILILQAISLEAQGQRELALDQLEKSLHLAQSEPYLRTFLDEGPQVGLLLQALRARDLPPFIQSYTDELIRAFAQMPG